MRVQEERRYSDEAFYFDGAELVIDQASLQGVYPAVDVYDHRTMITTYEDANGRWLQRETSGLDIIPFYPGERMIGIQTNDERPDQRWEDGAEEFTYLLQGEPVKTYDIQPTDRILVRHTGFGKRRREDVFIAPVPANEHLPVDDFYHYRALGIITTEATLVTWGKGASHVEWLIDLVVANHYADDVVGLYQLKKQVGSASLQKMIDGSPVVSSYLKDFDEQHGQGFTPTMEPAERLAQLKAKVTPAIRERYRLPTGGTYWGY